MTLQTAKQITAMQILPNISRSTCNQVMKFGQLMKYNLRKIFFKSHGENETERPVKIYGESKWSTTILVLVYFSRPWLGHIKLWNMKLYNISDYWSTDTLKFDFPWKGLRLASPQHSEYDFSRKIFFILYSINWPIFIICFSSWDIG